MFVKLQPGGGYNPSYRTIYDFGAKASSTTTLNMPTSNSQWGTMQWGDEWATVNTTFRERVRGFGSGETVSHEFSHGGSNEPFWIAGMAYQLAARGEDLGDASS